VVPSTVTVTSIGHFVSFFLTSFPAGSAGTNAEGASSLLLLLLLLLLMLLLLLLATFLSLFSGEGLGGLKEEEGEETTTAAF
jgi:hypothetical protein